MATVSRVTIGKVADFPPGRIGSAILCGEKVLVANVDGKFYAMRAKCNQYGRTP
jgi:nitrite reductase/ring-hydroxylating ferredoxin subunit